MTGQKPYKNRQWLREKYVEERMTAAEMADEAGCAKSTILRWLKKHDVETRNRGDTGELPHERGNDVDESTLRELYWDEHLSLKEVAEVVGASSAMTVLRWMNEYGIDTRSEWRKYKPCSFRTHKSGYEQARAEYNDKRDMVYIHRLVAVAENGFDAVAEMDVHHKNGIPWDNRPSNLSIVSPEEHQRYHAAERRGEKGRFTA